MGAKTKGKEACGVNEMTGEKKSPLCRHPYQLKHDPQRIKKSTVRLDVTIKTWDPELRNFVATNTGFPYDSILLQSILSSFPTCLASSVPFEI